jgi:hypothetical protein
MARVPTAFGLDSLIENSRTERVMKSEILSGVTPSGPASAAEYEAAQRSFEPRSARLQIP